MFPRPLTPRLVCVRTRPPCGGAASFVFFFNDTATTEIYTLSLHDALPISGWDLGILYDWTPAFSVGGVIENIGRRSEEHTSELQSLAYLVCRLLLEKKKHITFACYTRRASIAMCTLTPISEKLTPTSPASI